MFLSPLNAAQRCPSRWLRFLMRTVSWNGTASVVVALDVDGMGVCCFPFRCFFWVGGLLERAAAVGKALDMEGSTMMICDC